MWSPLWQSIETTANGHGLYCGSQYEGLLMDIAPMAVALGPTQSTRPCKIPVLQERENISCRLHKLLADLEKM